MSTPRSTNEIREAYLGYFTERGHVLLPPWPLVPIGDPTSLFTSAGMQPFKPYFMGEAAPPSRRLTTVQRVFRTTDIEEVGDYSHLTCFQMLGNFSFGDYFKREAIQMAWDLLTRVFAIDPARLHCTIYLDDEEARGHWLDVGMPADRIHRRDEDLNYWFSFPKNAPGASGPCGPDSEIYFDRHPEQGPVDPELPLQYCAEHNAGVGYDNERFLEIWNLVFMQLYQHPDGHRTPLPAQNIDTGSGLERVAAVLQGKDSVYETDAFLPILEAAAAVLGVDYRTATASQAFAARAMTEHCRAAAMLVADGVVPSNEGRGYILRRVLRRAIFLARRAGAKQPFTAHLAAVAVETLREGNPHVAENAAFITRALSTEEERFVRTLEAGSQRLAVMLEGLGPGLALPGADAFLLYDTFGFPIELTREIAGERGVAVDNGGFEAALEEQRRRSRDAGRFLKGEPSPLLKAIGEEHSAFIGYSHVEADSQIVAIIREGSFEDVLLPGQQAEVILDSTPFYPEGGGQVGDHGTIRTPSGVLTVEDTQSTGGAIVHRGAVTEGEVRVGESALALVDVSFRNGSARNHTGTHLLHAALRATLGKHVRQQGSLVGPERLRFDFTHLEHVPREALREAEQIVNDRVRRDLEVAWRNTSYRNAIDSGALAFFGDKYGDQVRVVEIRDDGDMFSAELCGGTHVHRTGELGFLHVLRESSVAAGTRRIEALTGAAAETYLLDQQDRLLRIAERLATAPADIEERIDALQAELERLRKQSEELGRAQGSAAADGLVAAAEQVNGAHLVVARVDVGSADLLRDVADRVRARLHPSLLLLGAVVDGKVSFLAATTPDLTVRGVHAGNLVKDVARVAGGGGGGSPHLGTAGAKDASKLDVALAEARRLGKLALSG